MRFTTFFLATAAASLAAALPAGSGEPHSENKPSPDATSVEALDITKFFLRRTGTGADATIESVDFYLKGRDGKTVFCPASKPINAPGNVIHDCEGNEANGNGYRWALQQPGKETEYALRVYHQTGPASGLTGVGDAPLFCHAGGDGPEDFICSEVGTWTLYVDNGSQN